MANHTQPPRPRASVWSVLSVRDLVAFGVIVTRTLAERGARDAHDLVSHAFEVADEFVAASEGGWAKGARANHAAASDRKT